MATRRMLMLPGVLLAAACVPKPDAGSAGGAALRTISLEAGPCFGACPSYRVEARSDGGGTFAGERFTAATGTREIRLPAGAFARLEASLARYKPAAGALKRIMPGEPGCERQATDMPGYELDWSDGAKLSYYSGCMDAANQPLRNAIRAAPEVLGIEALLKPAG
jgi:hypothetical protein